MLMKLSKLFVLGTFGLMSLSVSAALEERIAPEAPATGAIDLESIDKTPVDFVVGNAYVMYNTGADMYFYRGNAWTTQASGSADQALLVRFVESSEPGSLWLRDWDDRSGQEKWRTAFITTTDSKACTTLGLQAALFVDNNDGGAALMKVTDMGGKVYRISVSDKNSATVGAGISTDNTYFAVTDLSFDDDGMGGNAIDPVATDGNIDWQFYAVPEWDEYFAALTVFEKSEELKALIEKADEIGVDVSAAEAVYNNMASTVEQMEEAKKALGQAIASGISGSADAPGDATALIDNPNFDGASNAGWKGTAPNMAGDGNHSAADVAEVYNNTFDTYQELVGLPTGVYGLTASNTFRGSWEDYESGLDAAARLYATVGDNTYESPFDNMWSVLNTIKMGGQTEFGTSASENSGEHDGAIYYIPNDPSAARLYFEKGFYHNAVVFSTNDYSARIGVKNPAKNGTGDNWSIFDTFGLTYYGNEGTASYKAWLNDNAKLLYANEMKASKSYVDAFEATYANAAPADAAAANTAYETARKSNEMVELRKNISLWSQWEVALADAEKYTQGDYSGLSTAMTLGDYISEADYMTDLTNDQIKAELENIANMIDAIQAEAKSVLTKDEDVTRFLTNPDYSNGTTGWTIDFTGTNRGNTRVDQQCFEAWHNNGFDVYQIVKDVPVGIYEISVQGFVRYHDGTQAVNDWEAGNVPENIPVYVYLNSATTQFANIFENPMESGFFAEHGVNNFLTDSNGYEYPDNMAGAAAVFGLEDETKNYTKKAYGLIARAGDELRIGVKGTPTDCWPIWDNFKLTYRGFDDANLISPILQEAMQGIDTSKPMGKSIYAKVTEAIANANAALSSGNGETMFNALSAIFDLNEEINASVALFAELDKAREALVELMNESDNEEAINEVAQFTETLGDKIADHAYENEDVDALLLQIKAMRTKLRLPADYASASELNPVDMPIIDTPTFDNGVGGNSVEGWNADGYNFGNDDTQKSALALEFYNKAFDLNQTIYGVPSGNYVVSVNAFARLDEEKTNPVYLYANDEQVEVADLGADSGIGDMVSAVAAFDNGEYLNELPVTVGADGVLRIGIKKETNDVSTVDWVIMDNWKLTYLGGGGETPSLPGDVNSDGIVNVADIASIISQMAGTADYGKPADVNGDGIVNVADIANVITIMAESARKAKAALGEE